MSDDPGSPGPEDEPRARDAGDDSEPPRRRNTVLRVVLAIVIGVPAILLIIVLFVLGACFLAYS